MSFSQNLLAGVLALAGFLCFQSPVKAQDFGLGATVTPTTALLNSPIVFTINITNTYGFQLNNIYVTNVLSGEAVLNSATMTNAAGNALAGDIFTSDIGVLFVIGSLPNQGIARLTLSLTPKNGGQFTNQITVFAFARSNAATTVLATITAPSTDLAVGMTNVASGVLVGDTTVIGLSVSNLGPVTATGVVLNNTLPTSFKLLSISPTNSHTFTNGNLVLSLGSLTNGAIRRFQVAVQPTNAVTNFNLVASVFAGSIQDTNTANNVVTNVMTVSGFLPSDLIVTEVPPQRFNPQTGLMEMNVLLQNNAATNVPAARINVSGLSNGARLYNGVGTNNGDAYVVYNADLAGGASVPFLLEYYVLIRQPLTNITFQAFAVPAINLSAGTNGVLASITNSSGGIMIEFTATPGKTYTIVYASDSTFSNALTAQPSIVAPANRVQWIDNGPPKTVSHPSTTPTRVYRVFQSQ